MSPIARVVHDRIAEEQRRERAKVDGAIAAGPPAGSGIRTTAWENWHRYGWFTCPAKHDKMTCSNDACQFGAACRRFHAVGLDGGGEALPRKRRPTCGARTRDGSSCEMRVEPGSPRCRLHGGLSTGPKTKKGRQRLSWLMAYRRKYPDDLVAMEKAVRDKLKGIGNKIG